MIAPNRPYAPGQIIKLEGRKWAVTEVSHTGKFITVVTSDGKAPFRRERIAVSPTPENNHG